MKNVLITGSSSGIGAEMALYFAKSGYNVGITYNNSKDCAESLKHILDGICDAQVYFADVSNSDSCLNLCSEFIKHYKRIDTLINNAGISLISPVTDMSIDEWDKAIRTNLSSSFYLTKVFLPYFLKQKSGTIINVSSMWGVCGSSCETAYSASKAGLIGFTKALARELGPSGIRVNSISPGYIDTPMNGTLPEFVEKEYAEKASLQRIGNPSEIAKTALFLASDDSSYITGQNIIVDGGTI